MSVCASEDRSVRCPGAGVTSSCEPADKDWDPSLGLLEEQHMLLTAT